MEPLLVATRALHFAACIALFGELVFDLWVVRRPVPAAGGTRPIRLVPNRQRLVTMSAGGLLVALVSGALWLALQAISMSGEPLARALGDETLGVVLTQTLFGNVWLVRLALYFGLAVGLALRTSRALKAGAGRRISVLCAVFAAALLTSLALTGHANAESGPDRLIHVSADAIHLLGAGAWLGALPPLASMLATAHRASPARLDAMAHTVRRFSVLGVVAVAALLLSGVVNAGYLVGTPMNLVGTRYGQLLLLKVGLFGVMLALAAFNRLHPLPTGSRHDIAGRVLAASRLRRNALIELAVGLGVLLVVGVLGVSLPGRLADDTPAPPRHQKV